MHGITVSLLHLSSSVELLGELLAAFESGRLLKDELLQAVFWEIVQFHLVVEGLLRHGLISRFVVAGEVGVGEGRLHGDAEVWVKGEQLVQQVDGMRRGVRADHLAPRSAHLGRQALQVGAGALILNPVQVIRRAENVENQIEVL